MIDTLICTAVALALALMIWFLWIDRSVMAEPDLERERQDLAEW